MADDRDDDDDDEPEQNRAPLDPIRALFENVQKMLRLDTRTESVKTNESGRTSSTSSTSSNRSVGKSNSSVASSSGSRSSSLSVNSAGRMSTLGYGKRTSSSRSVGEKSQIKSSQTPASRPTKYTWKVPKASTRLLDEDDDEDDDEEDYSPKWPTRSASKHQTANTSATRTYYVKRTFPAAAYNYNTPTAMASTSIASSPNLHKQSQSSTSVVQHVRFQPAKCNLLTQELALASRETVKTISKQNEDIRKSFDERAKLVASLQTFRVQLADSIKHALDANRTGKSN